MAIIEVKHLHKVFGDLEVLKDISFNVEEGEVICLIGPVRFRKIHPAQMPEQTGREAGWRYCDSWRKYFRD